MSKKISWRQFLDVDLRVGTIVDAEAFQDMSNPAFILSIDFGPDIGIRRSSAHLTASYGRDSLVGRKIVAVINFPRRRIGEVISECLVTGFLGRNGKTVLCVPDGSVDNGTKLL